jgi:hypothetical protein
LNKDQHADERKQGVWRIVFWLMNRFLWKSNWEIFAIGNNTTCAISYGNLLKKRDNMKKSIHRLQKKRQGDTKKRQGGALSLREYI